MSVNSAEDKFRFVCLLISFALSQLTRNVCRVAVAAYTRHKRRLDLAPQQLFPVDLKIQLLFIDL